MLVGTVMQGTHIPIRTWLFVLMEMCASKNGLAAREVQRKYGLTPKSAWLLTQRIREVMVEKRPEALVGTIVADEAWIGGRARNKYGTITGHKPERYVPKKAIVLTLIHPESGRAQSKVIPNVTADTLYGAIVRQVQVRGSVLWTDEAKTYNTVGNQFDAHEQVWHSGGEYVRGNISTNAAESYFSQLKRSLDGTFHAVRHEHLHRYLAEFDYRHTTRKISDDARVQKLLDRFAGRSLTYEALTAA